VAEADKSSTYKFEVDLASAGSEQFNSVSGKYSVHLIIGDAAISNPIYWHFVSNISFCEFFVSNSHKDLQKQHINCTLCF